MSKRKTKWFLITLAAAAAIVVVGVGCLKLWIIPNIIEQKLHSKLSKFWDGRINVGDVQFNFFGPVYITGIELRDSRQRLWCRAGIIEATYSGLKQFRPKVTAIAIDGLTIDLFVDNGRISSPLEPGGEEKKGKKRNLSFLSIRNLSMSLRQGDDELIGIGDLIFSANQRGGEYEVKLVQPGFNPSEPIRITGTVNPDTLQVDLTVSADKFVRNEKLEIIRRLVGKKSDLRGQGHVTSDMIISGRTSDPVSLWPRGKVEFKDWMVTSGQRIAADKLNAMVTIAPLRIDVNDLNGEFFKGQLTAGASAKFFHDAPADISGHIRLINGSLSDIDDVFGKKRFKEGQISARVDFGMNGFDANSVTGSGKIVLDNADIQTIPIISEVFNQIGLGTATPTNFSDASAKFSFSGFLVTADTARIANMLTAVEVEKGGKVNLKTKEIDMYIVALPLKKVESFLRNVPVVSLFMSLKDKLVRLKVSGKWNEPPAKLISKQPVTDVAQGTLDFFKQAGTKGINFGENVVEELMKLF